MGCSKQETAPKEWTTWVKSRKESFEKKISTPAAVQFLYLKTGAPSFYLSKTSTSFKISPSPLQSGDIAYKLNFQEKSLLNNKGVKIGDDSAPIKINERIYLRIVFMPKDNKARIFLYDLKKKDLAKKRQRYFFEYQENGKFTALYSKSTSIKKVKFQRSDGSSEEFQILGVLTTKNGARFTVYAEVDQKEKEVMLMFRDSTNGESTYGAGRYLYVDLPSAPGDLKTGEVVKLDFNYAFNPPCAVSKGYHCPLPQDFANFKIENGEKYL